VGATRRPLRDDVVLRPVREDDVTALSEPPSAYGDHGPHAPPSPADTMSLESGGRLCVVAGGEVAGTVSWVWMRWGGTGPSSSPVIGIELLGGARGRGVGSAAQWRLVDLMFRHTGTHRVQAGTETTNVAEQRALERIGMRREGTVRGSHWRDGAHRDLDLYAILRPEWAALSGHDAPLPSDG